MVAPVVRPEVVAEPQVVDSPVKVGGGLAAVELEEAAWVAGRAVDGMVDAATAVAGSVAAKTAARGAVVRGAVAPSEAAASEAEVMASVVAVGSMETVAVAAEGVQAASWAEALVGGRMVAVGRAVEVTEVVAAEVGATGAAVLAEVGSVGVAGLAARLVARGNQGYAGGVQAVVEWVEAARAVARKAVVGREVAAQEAVQTEVARLVVAEKEGGLVVAVRAVAEMGPARAVAARVRVEVHLEWVRWVAVAAGTVVAVAAREVAVEVDPETAVAAMVWAEEARVGVEVETAEGVTEGAGKRAMEEAVLAMAVAVMDTAVQWAAGSAAAGQSEAAALGVDSVGKLVVAVQVGARATGVLGLVALRVTAAASRRTRHRVGTRLSPRLLVHSRDGKPPSDRRPDCTRRSPRRMPCRRAGLTSPTRSRTYRRRHRHLSASKASRDRMRPAAARAADGMGAGRLAEEATVELTAPAKAVGRRGEVNWAVATAEAEQVESSGAVRMAGA